MPRANASNANDYQPEPAPTDAYTADELILV